MQLAATGYDTDVLVGVGANQIFLKISDAEVINNCTSVNNQTATMQHMNHVSSNSTNKTSEVKSKHR
jgi:hypothetical protein